MNQPANKRLAYRRTLVRCSAFAAAVVLLVPLLPWTSAAMVVPALSPFVLIAAGIGARSVGVATLIGLPVLIMVILRRRWFCRWACPVGLLTEAVGRLSPISGAGCQRVPGIGRGLVLVSFFSAAVGYPLLLWLDPLAIFSGLLGVWHDPSSPAPRVAAAALAGLLLLSAALPGVWCLKICPLGSTQELLALPRQVFFGKRDVSTAAIHTKKGQIETPPIPRRSVLAMGAATASAALGTWLGIAGRARAEAQKPSVLRPPGARPPRLFGRLCIRCGNCVRACPAGIIQAQWESDPIGDWLTPRLSIKDDYCREDCNACMQVCPSGAIGRASLEEKQQHPIGLAQVDLDRCLLALNQECRTMCLESCPYQAIQLHKWTWEDDRRYPIIEAEKCPGCGACKLACTPMDAIKIPPPEH